MNTTTLQTSPAPAISPDCVPPRRLGLAMGSAFLRTLFRFLPGGRKFVAPVRRVLQPIRSNVVGYTDRRTQQLLEAGRVIEQERADQAMEREYRRRVALNWKERARVLQVPRAWLSPTVAKPPGLLLRQAD